jgi:aminoglycoside phosphotransferase
MRQHRGTQMGFGSTAVNTALTFLARNWQALALDRFGAPSELTCIVLTPRFQASAHVVFLVLREQSTNPVLVVKLSRLPGEGGLLEREAGNLRAVHAARPGGFSSIPLLLAYEEFAGTRLLLETAIAGQVLDAGRVRRQPSECAEAVLAWTTELHVATGQPPPDAATSFDHLLVRPLAAFERMVKPGLSSHRLISKTRELVQALQKGEFPSVFEHGDLSAPNILVSASGELGVVDWELAEPRGLPGHDLFFALTYLAFARHRAAQTKDYVAAFRGAFLSENGWAQPYIERYARALRLPDELLKPLFVASLCRYALKLIDRVSGGASPSSPTTEAVEWLQHNRYFLLWQHAVEHIDEIRLLPRRVQVRT